jgi:hypothetical protein
VEKQLKMVPSFRPIKPPQWLNDDGVFAVTEPVTAQFVIEEEQ